MHLFYILITAFLVSVSLVSVSNVFALYDGNTPPDDETEETDSTGGETEDSQGCGDGLFIQRPTPNRDPSLYPKTSWSPHGYFIGDVIDGQLALWFPSKESYYRVLSNDTLRKVCGEDTVMIPFNERGIVRVQVELDVENISYMRFTKPVTGKTVISGIEAYPNPFNPSVTIAYRLSEFSDVTVDIYNILGQKVRTLSNAMHQGPGRYAIKWDARNELWERVGSGIYFAHIRSGTDVKTMKLILLK